MLEELDAEIRIPAEPTGSSKPQDRKTSCSIVIPEKTANVACPETNRKNRTDPKRLTDLLKGETNGIMYWDNAYTNVRKAHLHSIQTMDETPRPSGSQLS